MVIRDRRLSKGDIGFMMFMSFCCGINAFGMSLRMLMAPAKFGAVDSPIYFNCGLFLLNFLGVIAVLAFVYVLTIAQAKGVLPWKFFAAFRTRRSAS